MTAKKNYLPIISKISTFVIIAAVGAFTVYGYQLGIFESIETFQHFIEKTGIWGPLIFLSFQAVQVIIPILPGVVTCVAGPLIFGPLEGFLYSYISICLGSLIAFYFARKYGTNIVKKFISEKNYEKYSGWLERGKKFDIFFTLAIFFPVAPDDILCFLAGLTKMTWKKFAAIIVFGEPFVIGAYSLAAMGFTEILNFI